jgi:glycosyltransferase involved in cell wall biosynthesis
VKVLVVSGIWPPDVGGPASHAPEVAGYLARRGHRVEVVTTASSAPAKEAYDVRWVRRDRPPGIRHLQGAALVRARARRADVVYTTGMFGRSALGARLAGRPYVLKLTADPAHERARRRALSEGDVEAFQREGGDLRVRVLRAARDAELRGAAHVFCPSSYLRELVVGWGVDPGRVEVLPNPLPALPPDLASRDAARTRWRLEGPTLVFAGRLTAQKSLDVALEALARTEAVELLVAGEGDERGSLERRVRELGLGGRVRFVGALARGEVLELLRAADALVLSSAWENFPHAVVESLAVGTPVIATAVGGVAEVVADGRNGLLVPSARPEALAGAIERFFADPALRERLRAEAAPSVESYAPERVYPRVEAALREAVGAR